MAVQRETIFAALFTRLQTIVDPELKDGKLARYATRIFESWDEVAPSQKPALQLRKGPESTPSRQSGAGLGLPPLWTLSAWIVVYAQNDEARDVPASTQVNEILTAIEAMLERTPTEGPALAALFPNNPGYRFGTTLGGLCYSCQIAGTVEVFEGSIDDTTVALVPLEILTTA